MLSFSNLRRVMSRNYKSLKLSTSRFSSQGAPTALVKDPANPRKYYL